MIGYLNSWNFDAMTNGETACVFIIGLWIPCKYSLEFMDIIKRLWCSESVRLSAAVNCLPFGGRRIKVSRRQVVRVIIHDSITAVIPRIRYW
jgi:hypothetical protein